MEWHILMKNGMRVDFQFEDQWGIRQQLFWEYGEEWIMLNGGGNR